MELWLYSKASLVLWLNAVGFNKKYPNNDMFREQTCGMQFPTCLQVGEALAQFLMALIRYCG